MIAMGLHDVNEGIIGIAVLSSENEIFSSDTILPLKPDDDNYNVSYDATIKLPEEVMRIALNKKSELSIHTHHSDTKNTVHYVHFHISGF